MGYVFDEDGKPVSGAKITLDGIIMLPQELMGALLYLICQWVSLSSLWKSWILPHSGEVGIEANSIITLKITLEYPTSNE